MSKKNESADLDFWINAWEKGQQEFAGSAEETKPQSSGMSFFGYATEAPSEDFNDDDMQVWMEISQVEKELRGSANPIDVGSVGVDQEIDDEGNERFANDVEKLSGLKRELAETKVKLNVAFANGESVTEHERKISRLRSTIDDLSNKLSGFRG